MDLLNNIRWNAKYVPKPSLVQERPSVDYTGLTKLQSDPFLEYLIKSENNQYETLENTLNKIPLYHEIVLALEDFITNNGSDYDKEGLVSTTALSLLKPSHTFLDEFGTFTMSKDASIPLIDPSKYLIQYEKQYGDIRDIKASYPRGKNTGLPVIVSGRNREVNNIVNVINLMAASTFQDWIYETSDDNFAALLDSTLGFMNREFGYATSQVVFMRGQHTGKPTYVRFANDMRSWYKSKNLFWRRRIVNSTIKFIAMALKASVKAITEVDLRCPAFEQDQVNVQKRIKDAITTGGVVLAMDSSRFDLRHGGDKKDHLYSTVLGPRYERMFGNAGKKLIMLSLVEAESTTLIPTPEGVYAGDGNLILKSGESLTSRKGSYMNLVDDMTITREALSLTDLGTCDYYLRYQPSVILGDDILKFFPSIDDATKYEKALNIVGPKMGILMELEKPTKYLGKLVVNTSTPFNADVKISHGIAGNYGQGDWIQPLLPIAQKTALPERFRSEQFPALAAMVKFFALPFNAPAPDDFKRATIPVSYLKSVKEFYMRLSKVRYSYGDSRYVYFAKVANALPDTVDELKTLYVDVLKNPSKYGVDITYDSDEILNLLMKGLEHDINWSVVGLGEPFEEAEEKGTITEVLNRMLNENTNNQTAEFVKELIMRTNELKSGAPDFIPSLYSIVARNHKSLGMRHSHHLPIW